MIKNYKNNNGFLRKVSNFPEILVDIIYETVLKNFCGVQDPMGGFIDFQVFSD